MEWVIKLNEPVFNLLLSWSIKILSLSALLLFDFRQSYPKMWFFSRLVVGKSLYDLQ